MHDVYIGIFNVVDCALSSMNYTCFNCVMRKTYLLLICTYIMYILRCWLLQIHTCFWSGYFVWCAYWSFECFWAFFYGWSFKIRVALNVLYWEHMFISDLGTVHDVYIRDFSVLGCVLSSRICACFKCLIMRNTCLFIFCVFWMKCIFWSGFWVAYENWMSFWFG